MLSDMTRRNLFQYSAGAWALSGLASQAWAAPFRHALGAQLYTVRFVIKEHEQEVLRRIAQIGYTEVEATIRDDLDAMAPLLAQDNLKLVSTHLDSALFSGKAQVSLEESIEKAKKHGVSYLVYPYVPPAERGGVEQYRKLADHMNEAGRKVHEAGMTFCYHNHAFEFGGEPGQRAIDVFEERLDKKFVNFELDVFWVSVAGHDPVEMLKKFSGRVPLLHLKDKKAGTPVQYNEKVPKDTFKEVGSGVVDIKAILSEAPRAGVKHYIVEQDQTPGDPVESLAMSYRFLRGVNL